MFRSVRRSEVQPFLQVQRYFNACVLFRAGIIVPPLVGIFSSNPGPKPGGSCARSDPHLPSNVPMRGCRQLPGAKGHELVKLHATGTKSVSRMSALEMKGQLGPPYYALHSKVRRQNSLYILKSIPVI